MTTVLDQIVPEMDTRRGACPFRDYYPMRADLSKLRRRPWPDQALALEALAWLPCGSLILTGENERRNFPVLTRFRASPPDR